MLTPGWALRAIGRPEHRVDVEWAAVKVATRYPTVLITGAAGSIGSMVGHMLDGAGARVIRTDIDRSFPSPLRVDVTEPDDVRDALEDCGAGLVIHAAGAKSAPAGETEPVTALKVNGEGTANVIEAARRVRWGCRVVTLSTCKAADPETTYGASKLLAERITLQAGQTVARFYNVVETAGNVFETWANLPDGPLPVTSCYRQFITLREAVWLVLASAVQEPGRYTLGDMERRWMPDVATDLYPGRTIQLVAPRRGDRAVEPFYAKCEWATKVERGSPLRRVLCPHTGTADAACLRPAA